MFMLAGLLVTVLVLTTVWVSRYSWSKRRQWKLAGKLPGPTGWPLLGNSLSFTGSSGETFNVFLQWVATFGTVIRVWIGPKLYVGLCDPADLQIVLGNPKIRNRDFSVSLAMEKFFGDGLLSNRDEVWRLHRKLITPAFHFKILESYVEIFARKATILAEKIRDLSDGRTTDISHQLSLCSLDAICETAIGMNMDIQRKGSSEFGKAIYEAMDLTHNRAVHPWLLLEWLYPWTSDGRKAKHVTETIRKFSEDIITAKLASYQKGTNSTKSVKTGGDKKVASFLDLLIDTSAREGQSLSPLAIRDEVTTMAVAGMETTSTTMAHALVLLGMHPEYQDILDEEFASIFQGDTRSATPEDVNKMKFLEYVVKETLRLFPSVTIMPREITEDLPISKGYILPAGCSAVVISYVTHRDPANFCEPDRFWPERWAAENSVGRHPYAFLPFSAGSRNCIGQKYAMLAIKSMMSCLLRQYRFGCDCYTMKELSQLEISVAVRSAVGYRLQIYKKKNIQV